MLAQRLRRRAKIKPTLVERLGHSDLLVTLYVVSRGHFLSGLICIAGQ